MKVLLVAAASDFTNGIHRALVQEGHWVVYVDERGLRRWPVLWRVVRRVPFLRRMSNRLLGWHLLRHARAFHPDLALIVKGTTVKEATLRALRGMGIRLANWFPENSRHEPYKSWLDRNIGSYDHFFCFDSGLLGRHSEFPRTRLTYLPLGVDPDAFRVGELSLADHRRYDADICFVGAWYPEREKLLAGISGREVKIFGWRGWERSSLAGWYGGPLDASESAKAFRCAKVVLNMNLEPPVNGVNAKTFEICAAGGFQLTDFRADLPGLFKEDAEVAVFRSAEGFRDALARYLGDPAARDQIARAGQKRVMRDHTMRHRVRTIIATFV